MLTRIITAVVALCLLIPILIFAPAWAVVCVWGLLGAIAVFEFASCLGLKKEYPLTIGAAVLTAVYIVFQNTRWGYSAWMIMHPDFELLWRNASFMAFSLLAVLFVIVAIVRHGKVPADRLVMLYGLCVYACIGFEAMASLSSLGVISFAQNIRQSGYCVYLWITLCIPWVADTLAYFTGRFFGKHKLCPNISPKKTVEGAIGGVASTGIVAVVVYGLNYSWEALPLVAVFVAAVLLAIVSIFGDLFASVVKRHFDVKDYGKLFPGHGGVMDRFDSTIPVAILMSVLIYIPFFSELL